jgi:opacity protein-like surface antigen
MKNSIHLLLTLFLFVSFTHFAAAQHKGGGFGIKGGLNYNTSGKYFKDAESIWKNPGASTGYHAGVFYKFGGYDLYLRPELIYTQTKFDSGLGEVNIQRLDAPVLVGMHLFKVASIMAGPSFHYTLSDNFSSRLVEKNDRLRFGYQFGLGLNFGPVGLDLRYEREFNDQNISFDRVISGGSDFKSEQVILGLSFQF